MGILFVAIALVSAGMFLVLRHKMRAPSPLRPAPRASRVAVAPGEAHLALAARWGDNDPALVPMFDAERRVTDLEQRYGISIPEDFRLYLLNTAPSGYYMDDIGTAWWTLADIKNIPDECGEHMLGGRRNPAVMAEESRYLVFADFLVWCYAWAICCSDGEHRGKIALVGAGDRFVADSFAHFVELELNDAHAIHPGVQLR
jgi:hypothetical protein